MDILACIISIYPDWSGKVVGNTHAGIMSEPNEIRPIPTEAQLESAWQQILAEQSATEYQRLRAAEYPPLTDLADAIAKDDPVALAEYRAKCMAVKALYPKPQP